MTYTVGEKRRHPTDPNWSAEIKRRDSDGELSVELTIAGEMSSTSYYPEREYTALFAHWPLVEPEPKPAGAVFAVEEVEKCLDDLQHQVWLAERNGVSLDTSDRAAKLTPLLNALLATKRQAPWEPDELTNVFFLCSDLGMDLSKPGTRQECVLAFIRGLAEKVDAANERMRAWDGIATEKDATIQRLRQELADVTLKWKVLIVSAKDGFPGLKKLAEDLRAQLAAAQERITKLLEVLYESHALNINVITNSDNETKAYYSEWARVFKMCEEALAAPAESGPNTEEHQ